MKINRNFLVSIAVSTFVISGLFVSQIKEDKNSGNEQSKTQIGSEVTSSATSTQSASEELSQLIEDPNPLNLPAGNIWTYNCEIPVQLPESLLLTCGDGGWYVYNIKWQSWGETEAKATAIYSENVCEPNCAEGYRVEAPVDLTISTVVKPGKEIYLTNLVMNASTEKNFKSGSRSLTWDLGEFAKMMDSE